MLEQSTVILNQESLSIFALRLAGKPAAQDKLTAKAVSTNGEVDRPLRLAGRPAAQDKLPKGQDETEGFRRW